MSTILPKLLIDDMLLHKNVAANKMGNILEAIEQSKKEKMTRTASMGSMGSVGNNKLITLLTSMLQTLNMRVKDDNVQEVVNKIGNTENDLNKSASMVKDSKERRDDIKIVSKSIKDSHYQVDVSKDIIQKSGKKMIMVSCYARDAYLGRYLIKRNYFYTEDRNTFADNAYDEILTKVAAIKDRYYNEIIDVSGIFTQLKQSLDGVISEIEIKEDSLGTTVRR
jgi:hypothetical protein